MYEFEYVKAASLDDATKRLANEEAKLVAGGMTLIPTLKFRLAKPAELIDLGGLGILNGITDDGHEVVIVGVYVAKTGGNVRVAVTGAGPCVFRVPEMEAALAKSFTPDAIKDIAIKDDGLNSDIHASAEYRAHLVNVMARRAVAACA